MNPTVSAIKGLAIIAMVLGHSHSSYHTTIVTFVNQFHMPIFFFIAGYCFKERYIQSPFLFLKKRITKLWWPYVKFGLIFLFFHNILFYCHLYSSDFGFREHTSTLYTSTQFIFFAKETLLFNHTEELLGGYWFLKVLFWASIFSFLWIYCFNRIKHFLVLGALFFLSLSILNNYFKFSYPYLPISSQIFTAAFIFLCGQVFAYYKIRTFKTFISLGLLILPFIGSLYWELYMATEFYDNSKFIPYLISAIIVTWSLFSLLSNIGQIKFLIFAGNNSLTILTWHFLSFKVISLLIVLIYNLPFTQISEFPVILEYSTSGWWIAYFVFAIASTLAIAYLKSYLEYPHFANTN